jgi:hypothetical protein
LLRLAAAVRTGGRSVIGWSMENVIHRRRRCCKWIGFPGLTASVRLDQLPELIVRSIQVTEYRHPSDAITGLTDLFGVTDHQAYGRRFVPSRR